MTDASDSHAPSDEDRRRFALYYRTRDRRLRDELIAEHQGLVRYCAKRFAGRGEPLDDLIQVAQLGLIKALERYDPEHGSPFSAFATPTMLGELKRHFRDKTWPLRVPRRASDLLVSIHQAIDTLSQTLGRVPTVPDLAQYMRVPEEDILTALDAGEAYRSQPLITDNRTDPERGRPLVPVDADDGGLDAARLDVRRALRALSEHEQRLVYLRFYEGLTQSEIAAQVGTSQVSVSRCLRRIYRHLEAGIRQEGASMTNRP